MAGHPNSADGKKPCPFCGVSKGRVVGENDLCLAITDKHPVTDHHVLIIPKRHVADYFELSPAEHGAALELLAEQKSRIEGLDSEVAGFNVGVNAGESAGQSVLHCHIHLIPRRKGDTNSPKGGVRSVIPERSAY